MPHDPSDSTPYELTVPVDGLLVRARVAGSGPPLVLVHGLGCSATSWEHNLATLACHARVYAVDLPGFGLSDKPEAIWSAERLAQVLARWCLATGLQKASFVGHSLGGEVCLWLAASYPTMVERLILASTPGLLPIRLSRRIGWLVVDGLREPLAFMPTLLRAYLKSGLLRMLRTARASEPSRLAEVIARVHAPTLVLWGARDTVVSLDEARHLVARLPNARLEVIPTGAHGVIFDAPEPFNRAVCEFMAQPAPMFVTFLPAETSELQPGSLE